MSLTFAEHALPNTGAHTTLSDMVWAPNINLFVAVGWNTSTLAGLVYTSPDGVTFTPQTPAANNQWRSVAYSPTAGAGSTPLLCAVSNNGANRVMTSPDGVNWTSRSASAVAGWRAVCWASGLSLFVAVGATSVAMWSADGINWTNGTGVPATKAFAGVAYSPSLNKLVAVANTAGTASVMTSTDGKAWTGQTHPNVLFLCPGGGSVGGSTNIVWSSTLNLFCAPAKITAGPNLWAPLTSPDGVTWTQQTLPVAADTATTFQGVCWDTVGSQFVGIGAQTVLNGKFVWTSPDGTNWTCSYPGVNLTFPDMTQIWNSPTFFVSTSSSGADLVVSGASLADSISPTTGHLGGGYALTITSAGGNGGFLAGARVFIDHFVTPFFLSGTQSDPTTITPATDKLSPVSAAVFYNEATNVVVGSTTSLTCNAPIGFSPQGSSLRLMDVLVLNPDSSTLNIPCFISGGFTYLNPHIDSVVAGSGPAAGGTAVTITGTNFYPFGGSTTPTTQIVYFGENQATSVVVASSTSITCVTPASTSDTNPVNIVLKPLVYSPVVFARGGYAYVYDIGAQATLNPGFTYTPSWFNLTSLPSEFIEFGQLCGDQPDEAIAFWSEELGGEFVAWMMEFFCAFPFDFLSDIDLNWFVDDDKKPGRRWVPTVEPPRLGWFQSIDGFAGASTLIIGGAPNNPRSFTEIASFATGNAGMLGGFPGVGTNFRNHFVYAGGGYTVGTTAPTIRLFDGLSDRILISMPSTSAGVVPKAIMSMVGVGETIYLSTLDTGTSAADFAGRVFAFNPLSGNLTQIGAGFTAGEVPYALCWHMGRLWCGTNKGNGTTGKIYFFRPGIDTGWTLDYTLSTSGAGGACSMASFQGNLLVGVDQTAGTFAKVLSRTPLGVWSTVNTATGGAATLNNGFLYLKEFNSNLYATYWNPDVPAVAKIYKFDGTTWSTVYTGAAGTIRPYIAMFTSKNVLYTAGGGNSLTASLISSSNGTSWTDLSANLTGGTATAVPIFGEVII